MMKIFAYLRVSSKGQEEKGTSYEIQLEEIKEWANYKHKGVEIVQLREKAISGGVPLKLRPMGIRFFNEVSKGDVFIASKFDRAFRNVADGLNVADELKSMGVGLVLKNISDSDVIKDISGKLIFTVLIAVAEMEKETIRNRMMEGKAHKREKGFWCGGRPPFGYKIIKSKEGSTLIEDPDKMALKDIILGLYSQGKTYREIESHMKNEENKISFATIARVIKKEGT